MAEKPQPDVTIERADSDDVDALVELWIELADDQRHHGSHLLAEDNRTVIRETMSRHVVTDTVLLARRAGAIVGFATFDVETGRYKQDVSRGIIHNVYVRERDRREGTGRELLAEVEKALETSGVDVISLQAMTENEKARRFYRRHGYEPHRIELEKPINSDTQISNGR